MKLYDTMSLILTLCSNPVICLLFCYCFICLIVSFMYIVKQNLKLVYQLNQFFIRDGKQDFLFQIFGHSLKN